MGTQVKVIADSRAPTGERLTTLQVRFPRFILAEFNTHRVASRNFRSSRAVPVEKLVNEVIESPFIPLAFTKNKAGMQGGGHLHGTLAGDAEEIWRQSAKLAAEQARRMAALGVHKQHANRLIEPYLYVDGVVSFTEWDNFFNLRLHPDAQPEFQELASHLCAALEQSTPIELDYGDWHLPYVKEAEFDMWGLEVIRKVSAARCAWVSYKPFDSTEEDEKDHTNIKRALATFDKLVGTPMHASPMEHVATPGNTHPSNFVGWVQWRHLLEEERAHG